MSDLINHYADQQLAASVQLAGGDLDWLASQRKQALSRFRKIGFPSQREENWRYTSLKPVTSKFLQVNVDRDIASVAIEDYLIDGLDNHRLVFVDGVLVPSYCSSENFVDSVTVDSFAHRVSEQPADSSLDLSRQTGEVLAEIDGFTALNLAFSSDGFIIDIQADTIVSKPIEILFVAATGNLVSQPRNSIRLGRHAKASIIERYVSTPGVQSLVNSTCKLTLEDGARLDYYLVQNQGDSAWQVHSTEAELKRDSWLGTRTITLGGALVRNNLQVTLGQPGGHCDMLGLYNTSGKQHVDNHTTMYHAAEHCTSRELYKGILDQRSRAVFHGRIKVEQNAQKTDATQANNNLLLSSNSEVDTKPQLEIYADDVKCAHGATVGQIDETSLFYLRSRGIGEEDARLLLTYAFLNDVLGEVEIEPLKLALEGTLAARFFAEEQPGKI